ncbi:FecR domain-containing protein [Bordetella genomosp. 12]|uniref:Iron dicitrate transport regulator FecR n=1 Tax=Bordetella genomosp. 12 TaxID=463035 RepID=A0A261VC63_9BORD|nr:FecR domain-containing protein [Bordetella genomosp. 12]OZI71417.1 hypothetical protein CAL22_16450 [Bordetella genomosp. 12]
MPHHTEQTLKTDYESLSHAAQWYATLQAEDASDADRHAWRAWLEASAKHALAWRHIEQISQKFDPLRTQGGRQAALTSTRIVRQAASGRRRAMGLIVTGIGLGIIGWSSGRNWWAANMADYHTSVGQQRELTLPDGTRIWLNTDSAVNVHYDDTSRSLTLVAGEILIQTAPDARGRPFFVNTSSGRLQALGTRFTVHLLDKQVQVDVFEGAVQILTAAGAERRVDAGQQARFGNESISPPGEAAQARQAWSRGIVVADNVPLSQLIDELSRYRRGHISVAPEVADLRVMGTYPANDSDRALALLEQTLPLRIQHPLPWWTTVGPR